MSFPRTLRVLGGAFASSGALTFTCGAVKITAAAEEPLVSGPSAAVGQDQAGATGPATGAVIAFFGGFRVFRELRLPSLPLLNKLISPARLGHAMFGMRDVVSGYELLYNRTTEWEGGEAEIKNLKRMWKEFVVDRGLLDGEKSRVVGPIKIGIVLVVMKIVGILMVDGTELGIPSILNSSLETAVSYLQIELLRIVFPPLVCGFMVSTGAWSSGDEDSDSEEEGPRPRRRTPILFPWLMENDNGLNTFGYNINSAQYFMGGMAMLILGSIFGIDVMSNPELLCSLFANHPADGFTPIINNSTQGQCLISPSYYFRGPSLTQVIGLGLLRTTQLVPKAASTCYISGGVLKLAFLELACIKILRHTGELLTFLKWVRRPNPKQRDPANQAAGPGPGPNRDPAQPQRPRVGFLDRLRGWRVRDFVPQPQTIVGGVRAASRGVVGGARAARRGVEHARRGVAALHENIAHIARLLFDRPIYVDPIVRERAHEREILLDERENLCDFLQRMLTAFLDRVFLPDSPIASMKEFFYRVSCSLRDCLSFVKDILLNTITFSNIMHQLKELWAALEECRHQNFAKQFRRHLKTILKFLCLWSVLSCDKVYDGVVPVYLQRTPSIVWLAPAAEAGYLVWEIGAKYGFLPDTTIEQLFNFTITPSEAVPVPENNTSGEGGKELLYQKGLVDPQELHQQLEEVFNFLDENAKGEDSEEEEGEEEDDEVDDEHSSSSLGRESDQ